MYESFYGLQERPFNLTSNPRYMLLTPSHAESFSSLKYGILKRIGIILLLGEAGTGKTTVIRATTASTPGCRFVVVNNPLLSSADFFWQLAQGFGLSAEAAVSKARFLSELSHSIAEQRTALIVDEAHALPFEILEEIRLLANIETNEDKLLPVVLAGQPELGTRLSEPGLRQLKQRVALRTVLRPLQLKETGAYIAGRIRVAGGDPLGIFTADAVKMVHAYSGGLPRTISVICDNALVTGLAADARPIGPRIIAEVCRDLDLTPVEPAVNRMPASPQAVMSAAQ